MILLTMGLWNKGPQKHYEPFHHFNNWTISVYPGTGAFTKNYVYEVAVDLND